MASLHRVEVVWLKLQCVPNQKQHSKEALLGVGDRQPQMPDFSCCKRLKQVGSKRNQVNQWKSKCSWLRIGSALLLGKPQKWRVKCREDEILESMRVPDKL